MKSIPEWRPRTERQKQSSARNWNKARLIGFRVDTSVMTKEEIDIYADIKNKIAILLKNWERNGDEFFNREFRPVPLPAISSKDLVASLLEGGPEGEFLKVARKLDRKIDPEGSYGSTFFFLDDECILQFTNSSVLINESLWNTIGCDHFDADYQATEEFFRVMLRKYFGKKFCSRKKMVTPISRIFAEQIGKYFKIKET